jgi:murein L,D-transpeptidase YcbB/YkuD
MEMGGRRASVCALALSVALVCGVFFDKAWAASGAGLRSKSAKASVSTAKLLKGKVQSGRLDDLRWPSFSGYRRSVTAFYATAHHELAWVKDSKPTDRSRQMIEVLEAADREGLNPEDYDGGRWAARVVRLNESHSVQEEVQFDLAMTVCAMRYISDLRNGRISPARVNFGYSIAKDKLDLASALSLVLSPTTDLKNTVEGFAPQSQDYRALRDALVKYEVLAKQDDGDVLPLPIGVVRRGGYYEAFHRLANRLRLMGDLPSDALLPRYMISYGGPLLDAVTRSQSRHGLGPTGELDADTVNALNVPLSSRVWQLRLAMEELRWLESRFSSPVVVVNLPEFKLRAYDARGRLALSMGVTVGDAYDFQTPVFESSISYVVFRPYWYVTRRILREEILPDLEQDRDYLGDSDMEVITPEGGVVAGGKINDEVLSQLRSGSLRVRQKPGPDNSLGLLKVVFPNEHSIYLHDTPANKNLFDSNKRASSHGCIHLERPAEFASWLLANKRGWNIERIEEAMTAGRNSTRVDLARSIPILIFYGTALVENGEVHFYKDIYGHDTTLKAALSQGYPSR